MNPDTPIDIKALAQKLQVRESGLEYLAFHCHLPSQYSGFSIVQRNGKKREISAPVPHLKAIQRSLAKYLSNFYEIPGPVHGYVPGKNIVSNAQRHIRPAWILNLDIKDFFPSITFARILGLLKGSPFNFPKEVAVAIARLATLEKSLPQGSPLSPLLSNLICRKMDRQLMSLARLNSFFYTRYADDLTFSARSRRLLREGRYFDDHVLMEIRNTIDRNGFRVNDDKTRFSYGSNGGIVTGLRVRATVTLHRKHIRELRVIHHKVRSHGIQAAEKEFQEKYQNNNRGNRVTSLAHHVSGKLSFAYSVLGPYNAVYKNYFQKLSKQFPNLLTAPRPLSEWDSIFVVESYNPGLQGTAFLIKGIGLVTCHHVLGSDPQIIHCENPMDRFDTKVLKADSELDLAILESPFDNSGPGLEADYHSPYNRGETLHVFGFPNYRVNDSGTQKTVSITGHRYFPRDELRVLISAGIVSGNSGGPVLNQQGRVVGVAVTGADREEDTEQTENVSFIPIKYIRRLL